MFLILCLKIGQSFDIKSDLCYNYLRKEVILYGLYYKKNGNANSGFTAAEGTKPE
jgi:hypothetical protein